MLLNASVNILSSLSKLLIIVISSLFAIIIIELLVRVEEHYFGILKDSTYAVSILERHSEWHHQPVPNIKVKLSYPYKTSHLNKRFYNKFTNDESCYESINIKDNLDKDIVIITGDSFTEGYYYKDTISYKFNSLSKKDNLLAFNCSSASYSIHPIFVRLQKQLIKFNPKYLILNIDPTDIFDDTVRYATIADYSDKNKNRPLKLNRYYENFLTPIASLLKKNSILFNHLNERLEFIRFTFGTETEISDPNFINRSLDYENIYSYYNFDRRSESHISEISKYMELLQGFSNYCKSNNIKLILSIYPFREHFASESYLTERNMFSFDTFFFEKIINFSKKNNIDLINSYSLIAKYKNNLDEVYFEGDQHFNTNGQKIWTDYVAKEIIKNL